MKTGSIWHFFTIDFLFFLLLAVSIIVESNATYNHSSSRTKRWKNQLKHLQTTKYSVKPLINKERFNQKIKRTQVDHEQFRSKVSYNQLPLSLAKKQIKEYYKCLNESHRGTRNIYRALVVKVGQTLVLKCHQW